MSNPKNDNFGCWDDGSREIHRSWWGSYSKRDGRFIRHSNGTTSMILGDTIYHDDGSTSQIAGNTISHSNGSRSKVVGNMVYHSDGTKSWIVGNIIYHERIMESEIRYDNGCYLTTACVQAKNLPDDCEELTILRKFRDGYLINRPGGREDIKHYYQTAPRVVAKMSEAPDAREKFASLYQSLVVPCVRYIKEGKYEAAYQLYKETALKLEKM